MNLKERETILFEIEELERLILGSYIYDPEYKIVKENRRKKIVKRGDDPNG